MGEKTIQSRDMYDRQIDSSIHKNIRVLDRDPPAKSVFWPTPDSKPKPVNLHHPVTLTAVVTKRIIPEAPHQNEASTPPRRSIRMQSTQREMT